MCNESGNTAENTNNTDIKIAITKLTQEEFKGFINLCAYLQDTADNQERIFDFLRLIC